MKKPKQTNPWSRGKGNTGKTWSPAEWESTLKPHVEPALVKVVEQEKDERKKKKKKNKGKKREDWWRNKQQQYHGSSSTSAKEHSNFIEI